MKLLAAISLVLTTVAQASAHDKRAAPKGIDVSSSQPDINWPAVKANGIEFAYIKATEGLNYIDPQFSSQYTGATNNNIIRGSYHFAHPDISPGATQAQYFLAHGGLWSGDGRTLPGALDLEYGPRDAPCYGLRAPAMVAWIRDFSNSYWNNTSRYPVIYTTTDWWKNCTGNNPTFGITNPLWISRYGPTIGPVPAGWVNTTFWQYASSGPNPGEQDVFNGDTAGLKRLAGP